MDRAAAPGPSLSKKFIFQKKWIELRFSKTIFFQQKEKSPPGAFRWLISAYFFKRKKTDATRAFQKILLKKTVDWTAWDQLSKKSISNKKKGPHLAQRHDSNSVFRRLIAAYLKKNRPRHDPGPGLCKKFFFKQN